MADLADVANLSTEDAAARYESQHVHDVYNTIAPHFSATRHKPWPRIANFLCSLPAGSVGLDVGCGNGKYLDVNPDIHVLGSDRSEELVKLAAQRRTPRSGLAEVAVADGFDLPYRAGAFDFVISVAVLHHMSTSARRRHALRLLLSHVSPAGQVLVYVWALEQASSRRGWDESSEQDRMVSWVMKGKKDDANPNVGKTFQRYYHLYREGELEADVRSVGGVLVDSGYERDNWWVICKRDPESNTKT